ncbi:MAG: FlgD immunoglobulin-like domain containing protein, partial [Candidatus Poribacteria bacterium]
MKVTSRTLGVLTEKIKFTLSGSYKGALVQRKFTVSSTNGIRIGEEPSGGDLYDTITSISDISGAADGDSVALEWFTGNAVVKIYSNDGIYIQTLNTIPIYIGDRENYHVRWGEKPYDVPDGVYTYKILAEDGTGNVSQRSGQIILSNSTIEILEHKPTPDRISPGNEDGQYDETSINYNLSKTGFVTVKIFDSQDNLIKTLVDDGKPQEAGAQSKVWDGTDNDGNIVSEGEWAIYTYVITAVDPLTSETVKASGNIVVDNQSPERAPRLNPIPPYTNNDLITISGTAEAGATVQISVGDVLAGEVTASTTTGEFTLIEIPLNEGRNTITAVALDSVANKSDSSAPLEIQVDKTPPVTIVKNVPKDWRQDVPVNLEAVDEGGSGVLQTYYTTDGSTPTTSSRQGNEVTLSENGVYLLRFFSQDNAGNIESVKQAADYIRIDKNSPTLEIISTSKEEAFFGSLPMIIISGTADDDGSGVKEVEIQITPGASEDSWLVANGTSDWLYSFIPDVVSDSYEVHVRATDNAGNQAEAETTVSLTGTTSPSELTATPISEGRIRLTWKDEGGIYKIYRSNFSGFVPDDAKNWVASVEDVDGVWLDDNTTDQTEYYYKIGRDAEDAASKKEASAIADKTPPTIENISATPNPFSPNKDGVDDITTISFTLTEETFVTLGIYTSDESSEPIKGLIYEALPAGDNLVAWDGTDDEGKLVNEGNYIYRFEKASTLDTAGNTLSQDISGTITCTPVPPLEVKMLDAQPNPFSPDGDKINDVINLNYILSDFADYVVVNIFDTSGP